MQLRMTGQNIVYCKNKSGSGFYPQISGNASYEKYSFVILPSGF